MRLAVMHNLYFYNTLMLRIRQALDEGTFSQFRARYSGLLEKPRTENQGEFAENPCQAGK